MQACCKPVVYLLPIALLKTARTYVARTLPWDMCCRRSKGIQRARVYVSANNLVTITNYTGYDPEVNTYGGQNTAIGIDNLSTCN